MEIGYENQTRQNPEEESNQCGLIPPSKAVSTKLLTATKGQQKTPEIREEVMVVNPVAVLVRVVGKCPVELEELLITEVEVCIRLKPESCRRPKKPSEQRRKNQRP